MMIESDARRYIYEAINAEKEIVSVEILEKAKGKIFIESPDYNKCRKKLVQVLGQINSVANSEGRGRDDLTVEIL
jgi:hypothetical protein